MWVLGLNVQGLGVMVDGGGYRPDAVGLHRVTGAIVKVSHLTAVLSGSEFALSGLGFKVRSSNRDNPDPVPPARDPPRPPTLEETHF